MVRICLDITWQLLVAPEVLTRLCTHTGGGVKFMNIMRLSPIIGLCYLAKVKYFADLSKVSNQLTFKSVKEKLSWA